MADRCEPPAELRGQDGWHWVDADRPLICQWLCADDYQLEDAWKMPSGLLHTPESAYRRGYRYEAPVTPPAEVAALRAEVERLTAKLADDRKGEEAVRSFKLLADMLRADGVAQHKDESNVQYVGRALRTARADLARLVAAGENVINATNACPRFERGAGGMSIGAQIRRTEINRVPAWPFEELMDALAAIKERKT